MSAQDDLSHLDVSVCSRLTCILFIAITGLYHLAIKTGDEKNAGTDANVWVQVYGDKGDTGHVQLKKSGMMENLFERGQTDYFTLEAGDVGKVTINHIDYQQGRREGCKKVYTLH